MSIEDAPTTTPEPTSTNTSLAPVQSDPPQNQQAMTSIPPTDPSTTAAPAPRPVPGATTIPGGGPPVSQPELPPIDNALGHATYSLSPIALPAAYAGMHGVRMTIGNDGSAAFGSLVLLIAFNQTNPHVTAYNPIHLVAVNAPPIVFGGLRCSANGDRTVDCNWDGRFNPGATVSVDFAYVDANPCTVALANQLDVVQLVPTPPGPAGPVTSWSPC